MANPNNNSIPQNMIIEISSGETDRKAEISTSRQLQPAADQRLTLAANPNNNSLPQKRASTNYGPKMIDVFLEIFPLKVVFKAIQERGEDDQEGVINTLLAYTALKNFICVLSKSTNSDHDEDPLSKAMKSLKDMKLFEEKALRAIERWGLEILIEDMVESIHAAKTEKEDDIQGLNCVGLKRKRKKQKVVGHKRSTTNITRGNRMKGFGVPGDGIITTVPRNVPAIAGGNGTLYFYFENVAHAPETVWDTIKRFLYKIEPEFVDSVHFCAAARKRGYIHNLPIDERFPILPIPPSTIDEALPLTKKWWPKWDPRTKLNCILTRNGSEKDTKKINEELDKSGPDPPEHVRKNVLEQCRRYNFVWVGKNKVARLKSDKIEVIMGFPKNHTSQVCETTRIKCLGNTFQVDTVAYHLSVLKKVFPNGIRVLSLFSGIGGAEVALHRLGISLKFVVSVEKSKDCRRILKNWWTQSKQQGKLIHFSDVKSVTLHKVMEWMEKAGGFDLVIGGSPCNNFSGINRKSRNGLAGEHSSLFFEYWRILYLVRIALQYRAKSRIALQYRAKSTS